MKIGMRSLKIRQCSLNPYDGGINADGSCCRLQIACLKETHTRELIEPSRVRKRWKQEFPEFLLPEHLLKYKDNVGKSSFQIMPLFDKSGELRKMRCRTAEIMLTLSTFPFLKRTQNIAAIVWLKCTVCSWKKVSIRPLRSAKLTLK